MLHLGYNTNGFYCHSLQSALEIISQLGYDCVAITLDHQALNPWQQDLDVELERVATILSACSLSCVIETGARFLLDPWYKHEPTLISSSYDGRKLRLDFLKKAVDIALRLKAEAVSFWSGKKPDSVNDEMAWKWLTSACRELAIYAEERSVCLAFEPEPGMFLETLSQYYELKQRVTSHQIGLTLDLGHVFLTEETSVGACIRHLKDDIHNIHIEDMKRGIHEHLFFGEGEMDFSEIVQTLKDIDYGGPINVELSRHSHDAVMTAEKAKEFLVKLM